MTLWENYMKIWERLGDTSPEEKTQSTETKEFLQEKRDHRNTEIDTSALASQIESYPCGSEPCFKCDL